MLKDVRGKIYDKIKKTVMDVFGSIKVKGTKIYSSTELRYLVDILLDQAEEDTKEHLKKSFLENALPYKPLEKIMADICEDYIYKIQDNIYTLLSKVQEAIKAYRVIVFLGAGFSVNAGIPLTNGLKNILKNIGASDFSELYNNEEKSRMFKERFIKDILEKKVIKETKAYTVVIEGFEEGKIIEIITTNWDNILEKVYKERYRKKIKKVNRDDKVPEKRDDERLYRCLWKLHGDVEDIEYEWIYPSNPKGRVFPLLEKYFKELLNRALVMLIVGYSESESEIKEKIIKPAEESWEEVYRIGVDLNRALKTRNYIVGFAETILPKIFGK